MPRATKSTAAALLDAAARVLADEGHEAVTARRLAKEVGASTMIVYTHFASMDDLFAALWQDGFSRFGRYLNAPPVTDDPLADWVAQGWAYRKFALDNGHLYRVMFAEGIRGDRDDAPSGPDATDETFGSLVRHLGRCGDAGVLDIDDAIAAAMVVWSTVHGHMSIELTGLFERLDLDPGAAYRECLVRLTIGFGGDAAPLRRSGPPISRRR